MDFEIAMYVEGVLPESWGDVAAELRENSFDWQHRGMRFRIGISAEDRKKAGFIGFKYFLKALEAELDKTILDMLLQGAASPAQHSGAAEPLRVISA